jgi:hypothetical protein
MQALRAKGSLNINRHRPRLLWSVQNFNYHHLTNSAMSVDDLLWNLRSSSDAPKGQWLLDRLFRSVQLVPVHKPHGSDKAAVRPAWPGPV